MQENCVETASQASAKIETDSAKGVQREPEAPPAFFRSSAVTVAVATLMAYAIVFAYEAGFCSFYDIPLNLITLNLTTGLAASGTVIAGLFTVLINRVPFGRIWLIKTDDQFRQWGDNLAYAAFFSVLFLRLGFNSIVIGCLLVLIPRSVSALVSRFPKLRLNITTEQGATYLQIIGRRLSPKVHFAAACVAMILTVCFAYGRFDGSFEPQYKFTADGQSYLLLRIYGDYLIAAPFTVKTNYETPVFFTAQRETVTLVDRRLRVFKLGEAGADSTFSIRTAPILTVGRAAKLGFWGWTTYYNETSP